MKEKKHTPGFNTPKDYFEEFEDRLFHKLSEDQIPNKNGFSVPDNYFKELEEKVLDRVYATEIESNKTKVIQLFSKRTIVYATAIAACAILVFSIISTNDPLINFDDIQLSSIESYIEEGNLGIDSYDVASLLKDDDLENLLLEKEFFSEESIEEYLLENLDDTTLLIE